MTTTRLSKWQSENSTTAIPPVQRSESKALPKTDKKIIVLSDKGKEQYAKAREMNQERSDFYCCATPERITKRSLKLQSRYVFTTKINDIDPEPIPSNQDRKEYRLQACIIKKAKENSWLLPFPSDSNKKWILIDAERNFADADKIDVGEGKKLDLLGYEAETKTYIVLELKANRDFAKANKELAQYTSTVEENIIENWKNKVKLI